MATWSHSRIEAFRHCPRQYFYRYVKKVKLPEEPETIEQFVGKRAHEALEWLYREVEHGRTPAPDGLLQRLRTVWTEEWHDGITMPGGELPPEEHRLEVERWLANYYRRHAPFTDSRAVGLEQPITFDLDAAGRVKMRGYIDRLAIGADGTWQIHDYKTNRRLPTQQDKDADPQLAYYQIGVRRSWPQAERVDLTWHFLKFDVSITSHRSDDQIGQVRASALATIADADARGKDESAYPTNESHLCPWCDFQQICPVRKHVVEVTKLPAKKFLNEPGVKLVDHWTALEARRAELRQQVEALETEIEELKEALAGFAKREGVEVVAGSEREATVKVAESIVFPRKSVETEQAEAFEERLRQSPWWAEASSLDRHALVHLWERRATLEAELRVLLEEFARSERTVEVRLRKRKGH